jgi:DNA polymerase
MKRRTSTEPPIGTALPLVPAQPSLPTLRQAASACQACELWKTGTQTVFGEGSPSASVVFVGEQPSHFEDQEGRPFVGPAGRLLDRALQAAGVDRSGVYVTNVVKHFKWVARGKRRIHEKPSAREIAACKPWLEAELGVLKPRAIVCLGATAAQALLGPKFRVTQQRGQPVDSPLARLVVATVHPSSVLRAPDESREQEMDHFFDDLRAIGRLLRELPEANP